VNDKMIEHQLSLDNAFAWVEFAYREANALLDAVHGRLAEGGFPSAHVWALRLEQGKNAAHRYAWLDCSWYLPADGEDPSKAVFAALSYASEERTGCHLIVGVADLNGSEAGLLKRPPKGEDRHRLLDEVVNGSDYPGAFEVSLRENDKLVEHVPLKTPKLYHQGLKKILSASFPVAWIDREERLTEIVDGLRALFAKNDGSVLGKLSQGAIAEATPEGAG